MGSGKGVIKEYFVSRYGAQSFGFSVALKDTLERLGLVVCRENYALLAEALRDTFGGNILTKAILKDISMVSAPIVVLEGMRKPVELEGLRELPNFHLLFVDTDLQIRYHRIRNRGVKADDATKTFEEFVRDHERDADREVGELKRIAHTVINNDGTLEELHVKLDVLMTRILGKEALK